MNEEHKVGEFKRLWESVGPIVKTVLVLTGGACLLAHIAHIGRFPEDVQLGEGVLLYFISCGFVVVYGLYWTGLTAIGSCLCRWPMELSRLIAHRSPRHAPAYMPTDFTTMASFPIWVLALVALAIFALIYHVQHFDLFVYSSLVVMQGALAGMLLVFRRRLRFEDTGLRLVEQSGRNTSEASLRQGARVLLGFWLLGPLLLGRNQGSLVEAAFTMAQIRKIHATVHVAIPWDTRLTDAGLIKQPSFLGPRYARFDDVIVSHMSIGSRVSIEIPDKGRKPKQVHIPRGLIEVE